MRRLPDRLLVSVVLSGIICALVGLLANWVPYADLDSWTYDFLVNHGRYAQPSDDVVSWISMIDLRPNSAVPDAPFDHRSGD